MFWIRLKSILPSPESGLTVEAACVLPLFLWAVLGALYLIEVSVVRWAVGGIHEAGRKMALLSYGIYGGTSEEEKGTGVGEVVGGALTAVYAKNLILKKAELGETLLKENVKVSLVTSDFSDKDIIDLRVMSRIQLPFLYIGFGGLKFLERTGSGLDGKIALKWKWQTGMRTKERWSMWP